jgi:hypothetical protein
MNRLILAIVLALPSTLLAQTFTYAPINVPGGTQTEARGINSSGEVVGFYYTTNCVEPTEVQFPNCIVQGFKMVNGTIIKLMVPNSMSTAILGVNDYGDLVGFTRLNDGSAHGFLWLHTNVVKLLNAPFAGGNSDEHTVPFGVNKALTVVGGVWFYSDQQGSGGWVWQNGTFSNMNPGDTVSGTCCWSVNGISNNGFLSGTNLYHGFVSAWFKSATDEDFYPVTRDTNGTAVNSNSDVIGYFASGKGWFAKHIESNEGTNDATEVKPGFIPVAYPNAKATYPMGLNDMRWIAGVYKDSSGVMHGFIAKPNF